MGNQHPSRTNTGWVLIHFEDTLYFPFCQYNAIYITIIAQFDLYNPLLSIAFGILKAIICSIPFEVLKYINRFVRYMPIEAYYFFSYPF
jgi:hypothetical protein